ncbi:MFS transporter [Geothrix sp. PMB-07]|uniref:MFS transporter n=1 Tax=Geothrix sp. PMB-07 TaxID=3068640 RepID=UPI0027423DDA|nr:MFS transporter [Geothrix sp. PMB-07]WLT32180.1 MFS transporter [Geothrix sp. PMB-07]
MTSEPTFREKYSFPASFWNANLTELFERAAYYSMASFIVIYLGRLGLGDYWPSTLNSVLWFLVYFLPILSGTIADQIGFRRSLLMACVLLVGGYFLMGYPVWFGGQTLAPQAGRDVTAGMGVMLPVAAAILLIGIGASFVKPCIAGTVQRTHLGKATLAFGIFYTVINVGSVFGRLTAFFVRTKLGKLDTIFIVSMIASVLAFLVVTLLYRDPEAAVDLSKPKRSLGEIFIGMFKVLGNGRFAMFLLVSSGFYFIYNQVYNVLPLYVSKTVELGPRMDLYTLANPLTIVLFQLVITKVFGKLPPIKSIIVGTVIIGLAMLINVAPLFMAGGVTMRVWLPLGSLFVVMTVALIAFGELFAASRLYEYIGSLAPKGQEGLFLGYANLPMAIGSLVGGPAGAWLFNKVMCAGAVKQSSGLLQLDPKAAASGWIILTLFGLGSALSLWVYNRWLQKQG